MWRIRIRMMSKESDSSRAGMGDARKRGMPKDGKWRILMMMMMPWWHHGWAQIPTHLTAHARKSNAVVEPLKHCHGFFLFLFPIPPFFSS